MNIVLSWVVHQEECFIDVVVIVAFSLLGKKTRKKKRERESKKKENHHKNLPVREYIKIIQTTK